MSKGDFALRVKSWMAVTASVAHATVISLGSGQRRIGAAEPVALPLEILCAGDR